MASVKVSIPGNTWTDISQGEANGSMRHYAGRTDVLMVQAVAAPSITPASENAIAAILKPNEAKYFNDLVSERIWAWSEDHDSVLVITPKEI